MINIIFLFSLVLFSISIAQAEPFAEGNAKIGKSMVEKHCISCHATRFDDNGDGSSMYTRPDRKVKSSAALLTQLRACNTNLGLKWFEDEELHVARYLNQTYYKFDK